jgi:hypothetical protein
MRTPRHEPSQAAIRVAPFTASLGAGFTSLPTTFMVKKIKDVAGAAPEDSAQEKIPEQTAEQDAKRRPIKTFYEDDIGVSIWSRQVRIRGKFVTFHSFTFERSYKDAFGQYRYTKSFNLEDLPKIISLAKQAGEYIEPLLPEEHTESQAA